MKRGQDHRKRERKPASASEAASRAAMNDRGKSAKKQQQADQAAAARSRMQALLSRGSMQSSHGAAASSDNVDGGQSAADDAAPGSDSALTGLQDPDAARASGASTAVHAAVARSSGQQARVVAQAPPPRALHPQTQRPGRPPSAQRATARRPPYYVPRPRRRRLQKPAAQRDLRASKCAW